MYIIWVMLAFSALYLVPIIWGPSIWDRLLGLNLITVKIVAMIIAFAAVHDTAYMLDFAIVYSLFGFIGTIFISVFLCEHRRKRQKKGGEG